MRPWPLTLGILAAALPSLTILLSLPLDLPWHYYRLPSHFISLPSNLTLNFPLGLLMSPLLVLHSAPILHLAVVDVQSAAAMPTMTSAQTYNH